MNKHNILEVLKKEVDIPEVVQAKADEAFAAIHRQGKVRNINRAQEEKRRNKKRGSVFPKKRMALIIVAAVMTFATMTVAAAYLNWSKSLSEGMQLTEEQKVEMEESKMVTFVNQASTDQGITVTAVQSITANYYTHLAFKVEGYALEDEIQPSFEDVKVTVGGKDDFNYSASFYDGLITGMDGRAARADGTPIDYESNTFLGVYQLEDGSMEYRMTLFHPTDKEYFMNKPIHVEMKNLGTVAKAEYFNEIDGNWSFDWTLQGCGDMKEVKLNERIGDTNATLVRAELSPISLLVEYEFPRKQVTEIGIDENGQEASVNLYAEPPYFTGIKMKDGTCYPFLNAGPGSTGYQSEESDLYRATFAIDRMIDVDQIESLLFVKSSPENGQYTEENFYVIPIQ